MSEAPDPGEYLAEIAVTALEHGLSSIDDGAGPLVPFLMTEHDGEISIRRFVAQRLEQGVREARVAARQAARGGRRALAAWDGFITLDGQRTDAIFVAAAESGTGPTFTFCARYRYKGKKIEVIGEPEYVAFDEALFP